MEYFAAVCFQLRLICTDFVAEHNVMNDVPLWVSAKAYIRCNFFRPADAKRRGNQEYFVFFYCIFFCHFVLLHINISIAQLHLIRTGKAIALHLQPTGLYFSAQYNPQIRWISFLRCLAERLNFSNSLQLE